MEAADEISYLIGTGRLGSLEDDFAMDSSGSDRDSDTNEGDDATAVANPVYIESFFESLGEVSCCRKACMQTVLESSSKKRAIQSLLIQLNPKASNRSPKLTSRFRNTFLSIAIPMGMDAETMATASRLTNKFVLPFVGEVCSTLFCSVLGIHRNKKPTRYRQHAFDTLLLSPPKHKLVGQRGNKKLKGDIAERVINFIDGVSKQHGENSAVRLRKRKSINGTAVVSATSHQCVWLPSYFTRNNMYWLFLKEYCQTYLEQNQISIQEFMMKRHLHASQIPLSYNSFVSIWIGHSDMMWVRPQPPSSNVCDTCWLFKNVVRPSTSTEEFECVFEDQAAHMAIANALKAGYKADCLMATEGGTPVISFDFAQNLTIPGVHQVPSAFYFLSLLNIYCFGLHDEASKSQINYLYDEGLSGKGSNDVVSMVYKYLCGHAIGKTRDIILYADNCSGQNKNNLMVFFLCWLIQDGKFDKITLKFQAKGHTRNSCDRSFGLFKNAYIKMDFYTMDMICKTMDSLPMLSAVILDLHDFFDWSQLNTAFTKVKGIKSYQWFSFDVDHLGMVGCQTTVDAPIQWHRIWNGSKFDLAHRTPIERKGLPPLKQTDLFNKVRQRFIPHEYLAAWDSLCPPPTLDDLSIAQEGARQRRREYGARRSAKKVKGVLDQLALD